MASLPPSAVKNVCVCVCVFVDSHKLTSTKFNFSGFKDGVVIM